MTTEFGSVDHVMLHMHVILMTKIGNTNKRKIQFMLILMDQWYLHPIAVSLLSVKILNSKSIVTEGHFQHITHVEWFMHFGPPILGTATFSLMTISIFQVVLHRCWVEMIKLNFIQMENGQMVLVYQIFFHHTLHTLSILIFMSLVD